MGRVEESDLGRWRTMAASRVLAALADHAKKDVSFIPVKDPGTERWHATVRGREFELLLTGTKFFDTRAEKGGGGAIDLASHLFSTDFRGAVAYLRQKGL